MADRVDHAGGKFVNTIHHDTYRAIDPAQWDMQGKVVLITGASRGIGRSMALAFARAGASGIILAARSTSPLANVEQEVLHAAAESKGKEHVPKVLNVEMDVTSEEAVGAAAQQVEQEFGQLDILVNNAGFLETFKPVAESDPMEWWKAWEVNVKGTYLVTRALLPLLLKSEGGEKTVVNVSSKGAHLIYPGCSAYQPAKLAILRFTEFLEAEYAKDGLLPIAFHPGAVATEMGLSMPKERHAGLIDKPELAGDMLVWLTKERREWLAGRYVACQWDVTELEAKKDEIVKGDKLKVRMIV